MKNGVKVLIIILGLIIVGLVTYIVADKVVNFNKTEENVTNTVQNVASSAQENAVANTVQNTKDEEIDKKEIEEIAKRTYKNAYLAINGDENAYTYIKGEKYKVDTKMLRKYFTEKGLNKILNISYYEKIDGEYYITGPHVDFVNGIFSATDSGMRPLKVITYTNNTISATGQITEGEGDHDESPLKIEFVKDGDTWLVNDFE